MADISLRHGNKPAALKAIEGANASTPAQKGQLKRNKSFASLFDAPSSSASSSDFSVEKSGRKSFHAQRDGAGSHQR
jgi:hypothetical protein